MPFAYFAPQPIAAIAGLVTIVFQLLLIAGGNLSWLNWATIALAIPTLTTAGSHGCRLACRGSARKPARSVSCWRARSVVCILSIPPVANMISPAQLMNYSFNQIHLVNTYGAFGSVTRTRGEIVIEGTERHRVDGADKWRDTRSRVSQAIRRGAHANRPLSPAIGLADVVCGDVHACRAPMVPKAAR